MLRCAYSSPNGCHMIYLISFSGEHFGYLNNASMNILGYKGVFCWNPWIDSEKWDYWVEWCKCFILNIICPKGWSSLCWHQQCWSVPVFCMLLRDLFPGFIRCYWTPNAPGLVADENPRHGLWKFHFFLRELKKCYRWQNAEQFTIRSSLRRLVCPVWKVPAGWSSAGNLLGGDDTWVGWKE